MIYRHFSRKHIYLLTHSPLSNS